MLSGIFLGSIAFGVGNLTDQHTSLGYNISVIGLQPDLKVPDFILDRLFNKKLAKTWAFSFSLYKKGKGALTIGGYNTSKFSGPLEKFAIQLNNNNQ